MATIDAVVSAECRPRPAFGESYYIDGIWYVAVDDTLLSVDTNAL